MKMFPKVITGAIGLAGALAISTLTTQAQNLLVDGSFENGTFTGNPIGLSGPGYVDQGWANNFGGATPTQSSAYAESGTYSLLTYNAQFNNWNPVGTYQVVDGLNVGQPITVAQQYSLSVYAMAPTALSGTYGTPIDIQLQFFNAALGNVQTTETGWSALGAIGTWQKYTVTGIAPAGAVYAAPYLMFMDNGQTTTDNVYFDNAVLVAVPEPATIALLGMGLALPLYLIRRRK
ncbi:MAG TPA: PEP-CTERM sorting domain-containing protein [Candidatus Limnocylindrales bacterium]|nr:PEP-CTERM sorting domain-containing protein [Candidatus Limnocylindrales bacterium]